MKVTIALASLLPLLAAANPIDPNAGRTIEAPADAAPAPGAVKIRAVTYGGTGCPQGSVGSILSQDQTTVTLIFDSYSAQLGPSFQPAESRKNCQLNFALTYPGGFQYSVLNTDYRGYAEIDKGVTGTLKSTYYFSGSAQQTSTEANFIGPMTGDYTKHDEIENTSTIWSPCGAEGMLNINSQVRLTGDAKASGLLTTDSIDAKFVQKVAVQWRTCKNGGSSGSSSSTPAPEQVPVPEPEQEPEVAVPEPAPVVVKPEPVVSKPTPSRLSSPSPSPISAPSRPGSSWSQGANSGSLNPASGAGQNSQPQRPKGWTSGSTSMSWGS